MADAIHKLFRINLLYMPWKRILRDVKSYLEYPVWFWVRGQSAPDNHYHKMKRIAHLARRYGCETFIETGTYYGQTVNYAARHFRQVMSVEIFEPLYEYNRKQFAHRPEIRLFLGDSSQQLKAMIAESQGRILYWLDGHYSGSGTGIGEDVSPILNELDLIRQHARRGDCLLIDDLRLFGHDAGYPTVEETLEAIRRIDPAYHTYFDCDCIVAVPGADKQS